MVITTKSISNSKKVTLHPHIWGLFCYVYSVQSCLWNWTGVKTISCNMVRLNTYDSMDTKKDDTLKKGKTNPPKDDGYDYEVPDWMKNEWIMVRYRGYKDWIS